jgi:hypothetical protein
MTAGSTPCPGAWQLPALADRQPWNCFTPASKHSCCSPNAQSPPAKMYRPFASRLLLQAMEKSKYLQGGRAPCVSELDVAGRSCMDWVHCCPAAEHGPAAKKLIMFATDVYTSTHSCRQFVTSRLARGVGERGRFCTSCTASCCCAALHSGLLSQAASIFAGVFLYCVLLGCSCPVPCWGAAALCPAPHLLQEETRVVCWNPSHSSGSGGMNTLSANAAPHRDRATPATAAARAWSGRACQLASTLLHCCRLQCA